MGCPKLTYYQDETPLKVVYRANEQGQKPVQWFIRIDPLAEKYYSISPYAYVANNPIMYIDPDGREIVNHRNMVINNQNVITLLVSINQTLQQRTRLTNTCFTLEITGGDRYRKDGKIYSMTHNSEVAGAVDRSKHLIEEGARAVDLKITNDANGTITKDLIIKIAKELGVEFTMLYPNSDHIHMHLPANQSAENLTSDNRNIPSYEDLNPSTSNSQTTRNNDGNNAGTRSNVDSSNRNQSSRTSSIKSSIMGFIGKVENKIKSLYNFPY